MPPSEPIALDWQACWTGHVDISPSTPVPLAGYAGAPRVPVPGATGLEANWVLCRCDGADKRFVLVLAVDALFSSQDFETRLRAALEHYGIDLAALWSVASHTHFAPQIDPSKPRLGPVVTDHVAGVVQMIARSVATTQAGPAHSVASLSHGAAPAPGGVYRRRRGLKVQRNAPYLSYGTIMAPNPAVDIPRDLRLWGLMSAEHVPLAWIVHWPCHPVAAAPLNQISAAHVGALRAALRETGQGDDVPVIYLPGCSGDIRPDIRARTFSRRGLIPNPFQPSFARPTAKAVATFEQNIAAATAAAKAALAPLGPVSSGGYAMAQSPGPGQVPLRLTRLQLGPLEIVGLNSEPSFGWPDVLGLEDTTGAMAVTGYVGDIFGYMPTPEQIPEGGYEVEGFAAPFEFAASWREGPDVAPLLHSMLTATVLPWSC